MNRAVSMRLMHGAFMPIPSSGSLENRSDKLKWTGGCFSNVLTQVEKSGSCRRVVQCSSPIKASAGVQTEVIQVSPEDDTKVEEQQNQYLQEIQQLDSSSVSMWSRPIFRGKTKIVCTIGPSTNTREMLWKLAETGMNVARLNMSHGDHASHQKVIDLVKEYNKQKTML